MTNFLDLPQQVCLKIYSSYFQGLCVYKHNRSLDSDYARSQNNETYTIRENLSSLVKQLSARLAKSFLERVTLCILTIPQKLTVSLKHLGDQTPFLKVDRAVLGLAKHDAQLVLADRCDLLKLGQNNLMIENKDSLLATCTRLSRSTSSQMAPCSRLCQSGSSTG